MWFVDQAQVTISAGKGGRGCSSFAQPPYTRYPYPDGGDGGDGGDVVALADVNVATLLDFHFRHEFSAGHGRHGGSNKKTGKRGADCLLRVPVGTLIREAGRGATLRDLTSHGQQVIIARGGKGGLGNAALAAAASAHRRSPGKGSKSARRARLQRASSEAAQAMEGAPGEHRRIVLELKLIADVGIVGLPNAGKSSLLSRLSTARPKIGAYPFTTRYPVLGVVEAGAGKSFVACDIPGLIEGAHEGKGLGMRFLRHIERTRVLVHIVDLAAVDGQEPIRAFTQVNRELAAYSPALPRRPQLVVANKMDLPEARARLRRFQEAVFAAVWPISCATGEGIPALLQAIWGALQQLPLSGEDPLPISGRGRGRE